MTGTTDDGIPYAASDPHLLSWVHVAEVDSFLAAHQRYGRDPLDAAGQDEYVEQSGLVATALGADEVPATVAEVHEQLRAYRPELRSTPQAREAARFMLLNPPLPWALRPPYAVLGAAAVGMLPAWTRLPLRLPWLPVTEATGVRVAGQLLTSTIRWAMAA